MPFQQISLDQSIYKKKERSPISTALRTDGGTKKKGYIDGGTADSTNSFVEQQRAKWAEEDKQNKLAREQQMQKAQELGMRVGESMKQQAQQQVQQQEAIKQKVESDPESAAKEMYELIKTLPDDAKQQLLKQIFTPEGESTMSSGDKTINLGQKYNPIAGVFLEKGWAMFDPKGNINLNEPKATYEKGTFAETDDGGILNTATGEKIINSEDIPQGIASSDLLDVLKEARAYVVGLADPALLETMDAAGRSAFLANAETEYKNKVAYILAFVYNIPTEEASRMANNLPPLNESEVFGGVSNNDEEVVTQIAGVIKGKEVSAEEEAYYRKTYGDSAYELALKKNGEGTTQTTQATQTTGNKISLTKEQVDKITKELKSGTYVSATPEKKKTILEKILSDLWTGYQQGLEANRGFFERNK